MVLVLSATGTVIGLKVLVYRYQGAVHQVALLDPAARARPAGTGRFSIVAGPLNLLLLGADAGTAASGKPPDTMILVHVPAAMDRAYLISVPPDLRVGNETINARYQRGGPRLLSRTLTQLTGVRFDGAAIIDFAAFTRVVGLLGGVRLCVDRTGCQQLSSTQALEYVRQREGLPGGDFDRQRHEQQLLTALLRQAQPGRMATDPVKLDRVVRAAASALTVDTNGVALDRLAFALRHVQSGPLVGVRLPGYPKKIDGVDYLLPDPAAAGLYQAIGRDTVGQWVAANHAWVNGL
ncbi:MAG: LCP family protein [Micromonosporaceae bacterium]|nr:LCP family protein [Micromonosporaceae bacterium]